MKQIEQKYVQDETRPGRFRRECETDGPEIDRYTHGQATSPYYGQDCTAYFLVERPKPFNYEEGFRLAIAALGLVLFVVAPYLLLGLGAVYLARMAWKKYHARSAPAAPQDDTAVLAKVFDADWVPCCCTTLRQRGSMMLRYQNLRRGLIVFSPAVTTM
jgi:hypothetical protein